jgi:hypothetical protein
VVVRGVSAVYRARIGSFRVAKHVVQDFVDGPAECRQKQDGIVEVLFDQLADLFGHRDGVMFIGDEPQRNHRVIVQRIEVFPVL